MSALLSPYGVPARVYEAWRERKFELATCRFQLEELRRASRYPKFKHVLKPHLVGKMVNSLQRAHIVDDIPKRHKASDPQDSFLLDISDFAAADYLVTGDKKSGMLDLKTVGRARIMTVAAFAKDVLG